MLYILLRIAQNFTCVGGIVHLHLTASFSKIGERNGMFFIYLLNVGGRKYIFMNRNIFI